MMDTAEDQTFEAPLASYVIVGFPGDELPLKYRGLIFSKWLRSLRHGNNDYKTIPPEHFYKFYHLLIEALLKVPSVYVRLAVLSDETDVVLGFSVCRGDILDYVHVHKDLRRVGIGSKLIPEGLKTFSHVTKTWIPMWQAKYKHLEFDPKTTRHEYLEETK